MQQQKPLQKELEFFNKNKKDYLKLYNNKFLLIKERSLIGTFDTEELAYQDGLKNFGNKPFLIKQVRDTEENVSISSLYFGVSNASI